MKVSISFGEKCANLIGIVKDVYSFVDTTRNKTTEIIGAIYCDDSGIGVVNLPRESKYVILFKGINSPHYFSHGNPENWRQKIQYGNPGTPILEEISPLQVEENVGVIKITLIWENLTHMQTKYSAEYKEDGDESWTIAGETYLKTFPIGINKIGNYSFRVRGKNKAGVFGKYSNIRQYNVTVIKEDLIELNVPEPFEVGIED